MNELLNHMVEYAERCRMERYLEEDGRYRDSKRMSQKQIQALQGMLSEEGKQKLEDLLGELFLIESARMEAMCLAGISIGLELSRL